MRTLKNHPLFVPALTALILAVSAGLRLYALDISSYWIDEMVSLHFASHELWHSVFWDNNPPLYHLLLKGWVWLFGDAEATTRMLSVLFSVSATAVLMRIGLELRGWLGLLLFGLLHATSLFSVAYAQETRMYAMFELGMAVHLLYCLRLVRGEPRKAVKTDFRGYVASAAVMSLTHYLALIPIALGAILLGLKHYKRRVNLLLIVIAMIVAGAIELASYANFFKWDGLKWQLLKYSVEPGSRWPGELVGELLNSSWIYGAGIGMLAGMALARLAAGLRRRKTTGAISAETSALLAFLIVPVLVMFAMMFLIHRSVFLPRYFIYLIPAGVALIGLALADGLTKHLRITAFALVLLAIGTATALPGRYLPRKEPWREVASIVARHPDAPVLTTRTVAIGSPYLARVGARVEKWDPYADGVHLTRLKTHLALHKRVWIIENYWGGLPYMQSLSLKLKQLQLDVSELALKTDYSAPVLVMLVEKRTK